MYLSINFLLIYNHFVFRTLLTQQIKFVSHKLIKEKILFIKFFFIRITLNVKALIINIKKIAISKIPHHLVSSYMKLLKTQSNNNIFLLKQSKQTKI